MRQQLNLIDVRLLEAPVRPSLLVLAAIVAAAALGVGGHFSWERSAYQKLLARSAAEPMDAATVERAPDATFEARLRQIDRDELLLAVLTRVTDLPVNSAALLGQLAAALPDTLWLAEVELTGSRGLHISGGALDVAAVAVYANRLGKIATLGGVPIQLLTIEPRAAESAETAGAHDGSAPATLPAHYHFNLASETTPASPGGPR